MPLMRGQDSQGPYYKFGKHGHKYHYTPGSTVSRTTARNKAIKQAEAIMMHSPEVRKHRK